jgi:hypothetical protein
VQLILSLEVRRTRKNYEGWYGNESIELPLSERLVLKYLTGHTQAIYLPTNPELTK